MSLSGYMLPRAPEPKICSSPMPYLSQIAARRASSTSIPGEIIMLPGYRQTMPIAGSAHTQPDGAVLTSPAVFPPIGLRCRGRTERFACCRTVLIADGLG
jgi:hypothetical protein